jgi:polysaccharide pyruvyl transferase WcaK-like protein
MKIYFDALSLKPTTSIGTQAYIIAGMELIQRKYPNVEFFLLSVNPIVDEHYLKHTKLNYKLIPRRKSKIGTWKQVRKILKNVDAVVSSWGDAYISSPPHVLFRKALMLKKRGIPLILFTSSIGPFSSGIKKTLAVEGLKLFDVLSVRDSITYDYLKSLSLDNVKLVHDSAFVLSPSNDDRVKKLLIKAGLKENKYIGLNISVLMYNLFKEKKKDYAKLMADYAMWMSKTYKLPIVLIPHQIYPNCYKFTKEQYESRGGDDRYAISKVMEYINNFDDIVPLKGEYSPMELKGIIKGSEVFIGGRMHTIIGAISTATPSLIMQYSHKAGGMMRFLNMEEYLWDIEDSYEFLQQKTKLLWETRFLIREKLNKELPEIFKEIDGLANYLS